MNDKFLVFVLLWVIFFTLNSSANCINEYIQNPDSKITNCSSSYRLYNCSEPILNGYYYFVWRWNPYSKAFECQIENRNNFCDVWDNPDCRPICGEGLAIWLDENTGQRWCVNLTGEIRTDVMVKVLGINGTSTLKCGVNTGLYATYFHSGLFSNIIPDAKCRVDGDLNGDLTYDIFDIYYPYRYILKVENRAKRSRHS